MIAEKYGSRFVKLQREVMCRRWNEYFKINFIFIVGVKRKGGEGNSAYIIFIVFGTSHICQVLLDRT